MRVYSGLTIVSILTAATAFPLNGTVETVTTTKTSWSTIISTLSCPAPTTVTVYNAQCPDTTSSIANNANIVYQTLSNCHAGQVLTIDDELTTLTQPTTLPVVETIRDLVLVPGSAINLEYSAIATVTNVVYPSSMTGSNGQVVTCGTQVTTLTGDKTVLSKCPCTVQSTILEVTATGSGPVPTALIPLSNYIIKIVYVYVIETVVNEIPTTITRTATSTLTTIQTETETATATATVTAATTRATIPRPTMMTVDQVVFLLEYDTAYDGIAINNLRKRQATGLSDTLTALQGCLTQCSAIETCVAASYDEDLSSCSPLSRFDLSSRREASGLIFATVIFRPAVSSPSGSSSTLISFSASASPSAVISPSVSASSSAATVASSSTPLSVSTAPSASTATVPSLSTPSSASTAPTASTTPSSPAGSSVPTSSAGMITSGISGSSSETRSRSVLYPISNSSVILTRSSSSRASSSDIVLPVTDSSVSSTTFSSSSSTFSSATSSSAVITSSEISAITPVSNSSIISTTSSIRSSSSVTIVLPVTNSSTSALPTSTLLTSALPTSTLSTSTLSTSTSSTSALSTSTSTTSTLSTSTSSTSTSSTSTSSTSTSSTSTAPVAPLTKCAVVSGLLEYAPAISYCSSAYPLTASTSLVDTTITNIVTTSGPATTVISNVTIPFQTIVETVQTSTTTTLYISTELTVTDTVTVTETDTVSTTVSLTMRKRQASPTDAAGILSSILSRPTSDIEFACSCLQTPTITSVTVTQTALSTTIITPVVSNNLTITPVTTVQTTETDTITASVTVVATSTVDTTTTTTVTEVSTVTASSTAICAASAIPTSCDTGSSFVLMASGSDSAVNGQYASYQGFLFMNTVYSSATRFCFASNGDIKLFSQGSAGATVVSSTQSFFYTGQVGNYGPTVCTVAYLDDCTEVLECSAGNLVNQVVDVAVGNLAWLVDTTNSNYYGVTNPPPPITFVIQS